MENNDKKNQIDGESNDLSGLLLDYLASWKWFLLSIIVCVGVAYYYFSTIIPTYTVSASVYLNDDTTSKSNALTLNPTSSMLDMKEYIDETEIEILKSKNNLIKIVDSLKLSYQYFNVGTLRDVPVYHNTPVVAELDSVSLLNLGSPLNIRITKEGKTYVIHTSVRSGGAEIETDKTVSKLPTVLNLSCGKLSLKPSELTSDFSTPLKIVVTNPTSAAAALASRLNIEFAPKSMTILRISLNSSLPEQGKDVINALVSFYNQRIVEDKNRSAIQTEAFILDRLAMISGELKDVEERLRSYREQHNIADINQQTAMNLSQKSTTEAQISEVDAQIRILDEVENQVKRQNDFNTLPSVVADVGVKAEIDRYNAMANNYFNIARDLADDNEQVKEAQAKLNDQKNLVLRNISSARNGLRQQRSGIASIGGVSASQLSAQPTIDKGLQEIFREQSVKDNIYTFLLQKREEIAIQKTMATPTAQLIDNPTGSGPVAPNQLYFILGGLLLGIAIPAATIFVKRKLMPKFKDQEELERLTKLPIIGEICADNKKNHEPVVVRNNVASPIAELFRLLRNNINFVGRGKDNKVILLTSTISGEGKTFVALNLAMTYALTGKRTVVLGLDIRRPVLAHICGISNSRGITTYLSGQEPDLNSIIVQSNFSDNLYVLPAGPVPPNPNELLMSERMETIFSRLREEFDYIIVDSSPIGMVSDTFLFTHLTDVQIYVTRASYSSRKSLKVLHSAVSTGRLPHAYILINGVNMTSSSYIYRRYGHYGYNSKRTYGYGYGYVKDKKSEKQDNDD